MDMARGWYVQLSMFVGSYNKFKRGPKKKVQNFKTSNQNEQMEGKESTTRGKESGISKP